eukprot:4178040-Amphidinium_carterae.1
MVNMRGIVQAVMQITLHDKLWSEKDPSNQYKSCRKGIDILVFLPGDALPHYQHPEGRVHALMFP